MAIRSLPALALGLAALIGAACAPAKPAEALASPPDPSPAADYPAAGPAGSGVIASGTEPLAGLAARPYEAVPVPVAAFYRDLMQVFSRLGQDLAAAKRAQAVAKAFRDADAALQGGELPERYRSLYQSYPEFFHEPAELALADGSPWTAPPDWLALRQENDRQMEAYAGRIEGLSTFLGTEEVQAAMEAFGATMEALSPPED